MTKEEMIQECKNCFDCEDCKAHEDCEQFSRMLRIVVTPEDFGNFEKYWNERK